jgi:hypothetical protein
VHKSVGKYTVPSCTYHNCTDWKLCQSVVLVFLVFGGVCTAIRMCNVISIGMLRSIYFAYFHSVMKYGVFFGGWGEE